MYDVSDKTSLNNARKELQVTGCVRNVCFFPKKEEERNKECRGS
jgi:hypothetical protein